ncbi:MAG: tRNA (adenosine(37)-N6)-dimethylallyltransferase MiaA [bacterium]|nr:tRNA (adenosine(37)-N6)-dimethylallyltransferase MiaA [bacterium]
MLIVILGPTASGKSALALKIAKKLKGEVISADSRQVYKGLGIGSGQITKKEMMGVPHHLLGIVSPKRRYTVAQYRSHALFAIQRVLKKGNVPILVGGTPFYIYAVVDGWDIPEVKPNPLLRKRLEKLSAQELFAKLKKQDPRRAKTVEAKNKRRLIRALEVIASTGKPVPKLKKKPLPYPVLFLGMRKSPEELQRSIKRRFLAMLKKGLLAEVKKLKSSGLSWQRIESFGLEYREASWYLRGKISKTQMIEHTVKATEDFARRQMTWFKKDDRVHWFHNNRSALAFLVGRGILHSVRVSGYSKL